MTSGERHQERGGGPQFHAMVCINQGSVGCWTSDTTLSKQPKPQGSFLHLEKVSLKGWDVLLGIIAGRARCGRYCPRFGKFR